MRFTQWLEFFHNVYAYHIMVYTLHYNYICHLFIPQPQSSWKIEKSLRHEHFLQSSKCNIIYVIFASVYGFLKLLLKHFLRFCFCLSYLVWFSSLKKKKINLALLSLFLLRLLSNSWLCFYSTPCLKSLRY